MQCMTMVKRAWVQYLFLLCICLLDIQSAIPYLIRAQALVYQLQIYKQQTRKGGTLASWQSTSYFVVEQLCALGSLA